MVNNICNIFTTSIIQEQNIFETIKILIIKATSLFVNCITLLKTTEFVN